MERKKQKIQLGVLGILSIGAVASLYYGIITPAPGEHAGSDDAFLVSAHVPLDVAALTIKRQKSIFEQIERNPFQRKIAEGKEESAGLELSGLFWEGGTPKAVFGDTIAAVGDVVDGKEIVSINKECVVVKDAVRTYTIYFEKDAPASVGTIR